MAWSAFAVERRASQAQVAWHLRHADVGPGAYIVGRPRVTCRRLRIGRDLLIYSTHRQVWIGGQGIIEIGDRVFLNAGCMLTAREHLTIGDDVAIAYDAFVTDSDDHGLEGRPTRTSPTLIGNGSWVAARATILAGVTVGSRCVIATGAVVVDDVPDDTLAAGIPARPLRRLKYPPGVKRAWTD